MNHTLLNPGDILGASYFDSIDRQMLAEADAKKAKAVLANVIDLIGQHHAASVAIKANTDFSETGRKSKLAALVTKSDAQLAAYTGETISTLEANTQNLTQSLANAASIEPTVQETILIVERRALAANLDPLIAEAKLLELAANGKDDLSVMAIINAPAIAPLVRPDVAARAQSLMGARLLPDQSKALTDARNTLAVMNNAVASARHSFGTIPERRYLGVAD